ncbi:hypothetical protein ALC53_00418, partial [Atta colombica]
EARREALMQRAARCSCKRSTVKWWGIVAARGRAISLNGATITGVSLQPSRILTNHASLLAVGPARAYSRGKEEKRTKKRNHAESSGSCTYAGSAPDRCRGSLLLSQKQVLLLSLSPEPSLSPRHSLTLVS